MDLKSTVFNHEGIIPSKYTCNGEDISPPLEWSSVPENTKSFVFIFDDPDAPVGNWDHWILFNLPNSTSKLEENIKKYPEGTQLGRNSWGRNDYGGPCPPDKEHRYFFKLYALDTLLNLKEGANKTQVLNAMTGHILAESELMGRYNQPR